MELIQSFGQYLVANPAAMIAVTLYQGLWAMLGLWFAARNDHKIWFVVIAMSNTMGLVEIFYLARKTTFFKNFNING
jgi:hypothetical protein